MIKLNKRQEPDILIKNKTQWTEDYKTAKANKTSNLEDLKSRYRHSEIKDQILLETNRKCAYCESKIRHIYPGDIEHIKPKSDFEDDIFEWKNLTFSCGECNRRKLNNYDEQIGIINPYETDPEKHLFVSGALIFPRLGDDIGKIACLLFELNRTELAERRKDELDRLHLQLDNYARETNPLAKKLLKRQIDRLKDSSNEYSMVKKAFIDSQLKKFKKTTD